MLTYAVAALTLWRTPDIDLAKITTSIWGSEMNNRNGRTAARRMGLSMLALVIGAGLSAAPASARQASPWPKMETPGPVMPYGCSCVHNGLPGTVQYRYRWGNAPWKAVNLQTGYQQALCWTYASGSTVSPPLQFQLDVDMGDATRWVTYDIPRVQAPSKECKGIGSRGHYDINYKPQSGGRVIQVTRRK
jgi:hypothetical protein